VRVDRTFAFLDLCGFTAFTNTRGDAEAVAVLAQLRAIVRAAAEEHGVRVTKWLGDGVMLSGIEAAPVLHCCGAIRDRVAHSLPLSLRGGICSGHVIMFEGDDYIGASVNVAARLCDEAAPGSLLSTATTAQIAGVASLPAGTVTLSGFDEPIEVVTLSYAAAGEAGFPEYSLHIQ
jgi:class 3 adenylate cyclase